MAIFHVTAFDKDGSGELRRAVRADHLEFARGLGARLKLGGPLLSEDGEAMIGSVLVIEAEDRAELDALLAADPYVKAGLFKQVDIRPYRIVFPAPAPPHA
jgi:uncharacterized protein YciI